MWQLGCSPHTTLRISSSSYILAKIGFSFTRVSMAFPALELPQKVRSYLLACPCPTSWTPTSCAEQIAFPSPLYPAEWGLLSDLSHCLPTSSWYKWAELKDEATPGVVLKGCIPFPWALSLFLCKNALGCGAACHFGLSVLSLKLYH